MSRKKLTKEEAIRLITPVVDDEVDENIRVAFFKYIERDDEVRLQFESAKRIKVLVTTRYKSVKAPESLRKRVHDFLSAPGDHEEKKTENPYLDQPVTIPSRSDEPETTHTKDKSFGTKWVYGIAAAITAIGLLLGLFYFSQTERTIYNIEESVYTHYINNGGESMQPTIEANSLTDAEIKLSEMAGFPVTVPPLENTELEGVVYSNFAPGFKTPLLIYNIAGTDQYIYIFTFDYKQMEMNSSLTPDPEALKTCVNPRAYHVKEVNGKHVVSWRWDGTWYTAISNHDGKTLASMIKPLNK